MATVAIEITFTEEVLGSSPNTKEIYGEFIASKAPALECNAAQWNVMAQRSEGGA